MNIEYAMHSCTALLFCSVVALFLPMGCVDPIADATLPGAVNVLVVDGRITNLAESQFVRLNQSRSDPFTGRFGLVPVRQAIAEIVVDSVQVVALPEVEPGRYQAPNGFVGQIGHSYQLRFTLTDGRRYASTREIMQAVPPINRVTAQFNVTSLSPGQQLNGGYRAAHELFIDFTDPAGQPNQYRWDWILWERQEVCHSCTQGIYQITDDKGTLIEGCVPYKNFQLPTFFTFDYNCRTPCWEILYSNALNSLSDTYVDGNTVTRRRVAQIPFYQHAPCLVEIRQSALTPAAYQYGQKLQEQAQNTGGLADTPPSAPVGNIHNNTRPQEAVVGYFTASAVTAVRYWLDRRDATSLPLGATDPIGPSTMPGAELFFAFNQREPNPEVSVQPSRYRPPLAVCVPSDSRTPNKPVGWQE